MIVRSAILEGTVDAADQADFDAYMQNEVVAAIRTYPGICKVELKKLDHVDEGIAPPYMVFDLHFESLEAMNAALASETRQQVRDKIVQGMKPFKGRVYHVVYEQLV